MYTPLALHIHDNVLLERSLVRHAHLRRKSLVRSPSAAGARRGLLEHLINLLQAKALGLGNKEVRVDQAASAQRTPEEKHLGTEVAITGILTDQVGRDDGDELEASAHICTWRNGINIQYSRASWTR